jgi:cytochrome c2
MVAMIATLFVVAACSEEVIPTQEPVEFHPTAAAEVDRPDSSGDTAAPADDAPAASAGDPDAGRNLFISCAGCHSTDDSQVVGPGLGGIYARAGSRTSLDADAYLEQSVREPGAFIVDGFPAVMPSFDYFSDEDVQDMIAYLKSLG